MCDKNLFKRDIVCCCFHMHTCYPQRYISGTQVFCNKRRPFAVYARKKSHKENFVASSEQKKRKPVCFERVCSVLNPLPFRHPNSAVRSDSQFRWCKPPGFCPGQTVFSEIIALAKPVSKGHCFLVFSFHSRTVYSQLNFSGTQEC